MTRWMSPLPLYLLFVAWAPAALTAGELFPYTARIVADGASSHSGPGEKYYATDALVGGQSVEVYKHARGWAAIRPPKESFSWVPAEFLEPVDAATGVITGKQVVSRVGSQFEETRDVIQVFLDYGEEVDLLDPEPFPDADGERQWYMVSPPAGEFRWVRLSDVVSETTGESREADEIDVPRRLPTPDRLIDETMTASPNVGRDAIPVAGREDGSAVTTSEYASTYSSPSYTPIPPHSSGVPLVRPPLAASSSPEPATPQAATPEPHTSSRQPGSRWRDYRESLIDDHSQATAPAADRAGVSAAGSADPRVVATYAPQESGRFVSYTEQLNEIELEIATTVAKDPAFWSFAPARAQLANIAARAETAVERGRAQSLTRKIDRLDDLRSRYVRVVQGNSRSSADSLVDAERSSTFDDLERSYGSASSGGSLASSHRDEITGLLRPVVSKRPDAPAYALMDDNGQVRSFVSESPGVDLRSYVGRRVGVSGIVGYVPELRADHVTARRVDVVDKPLRR
ncbi:MAG: hypothetical protein KDA63_16170 [Planctomycetales bacterium]|nr:hypothetical protein [Planctomycetales bacterium]